MKPKGRPRRGQPAPVALTSMGVAVVEALAARRASAAAGPRTLADLARAVGCSPQQLRHALTGARPTPGPAAIARALPEVADSACATSA